MGAYILLENDFVYVQRNPETMEENFKTSKEANECPKFELDSKLCTYLVFVDVWKY